MEEAEEAESQEVLIKEESGEEMGSQELKTPAESAENDEKQEDELNIDQGGNAGEVGEGDVDGYTVDADREVKVEN